MESRGLSPRTVRFYHDKLYYVIEHITEKPLLDLAKQDIQQILMDLSCDPSVKHSYLRAVRAFFPRAEETNPMRHRNHHQPNCRRRPVRTAVRTFDNGLPLISPCRFVKKSAYLDRYISWWF